MKSYTKRYDRIC